MPPSTTITPQPSQTSESSTHGPSGVASKEENIYIPSFISKRPFYAGESTDDHGDYLEHQRAKKAKTVGGLEQPEVRTKASIPARTKWKKGACENCGAEGHMRKDCLQRQRKKGAKWTGRDIQADDMKYDTVKDSWDAKRDRWYNYDPREYKKTVAKYEEMEELRRLAHAQERQKKVEQDADEDDDDAGDKYAEEVDMGKHQPTSTKQLRIREDTAKYLVNLDLESAKYDPKTRTLVDSGATVDKASEMYAEEGFLRASGDAADFERAQRYAWEAQEKTGDSAQHLQANPTAGEFYRKKAAEEAEARRRAQEEELAKKYGVDAQQAVLPRELQMAVGENAEVFIEYDEFGMVKGQLKTMAKSKYKEDVLINNHTSIWGSYWHDFRWGYKCCHSFIKNSYCTGDDGIRAFEAADRQKMGTGTVHEAEEEERIPICSKQPEAPVPKAKGPNREGPKTFANGVTEEEMEEYRRMKAVADDPMAELLGKK